VLWVCGKGHVPKQMRRFFENDTVPKCHQLECLSDLMWGGIGLLLRMMHSLYVGHGMDP
jgi:hypothetical protein